ncbi:MAG: replicative DNA helicase [Pseudomonadales bacterium]|nr:MAG: replicative DNA helicase [Pseudomonadales bacterium]
MSDKHSEELLKQQPPHNIDIEKALLASLMSVEDSFDRVNEVVVVDDFYAKRHQYIFTAISHLAKVNEPYDSVMVHDWLETQKLLESAGGDSYLGDILNQSPASLFNLSAYAHRIRELSTLRELISTSNEMLSLAYDPKDLSVSEIMDSVESKVFAINEKLSKRSKQSGPVPVTSVLPNVIEQIQDLKSNPDGMIGLATNFTELNNKTQGLQSGNLVIVAARPSMGKTTFAMNLAESVLFQHDLPVVMFSIEMPAESIVTRLLSSWGAINQTRLRSGQLHEDEWAKLMSSVQYLQTKKLFIDDSSSLTPTEARSRCRRIAKDHGQIGLVVVDYLQLMSVPGSDNRVGEISEISRSLKALARELECPVVALSQLNRSLENRPNKRPIMSDLRESGAIEQDADLIMFIYRDEVYNENSDVKGQGEIIIGKQRNGPIGTVRLAFEGQFTRFTNLLPEFYQGGYDDE